MIGVLFFLAETLNPISYGWFPKLWSVFGYPKHQVPHYNGDPITLNPVSYVYIRKTTILENAGISVRPWVLGFGATCLELRV